MRMGLNSTIEPMTVTSYGINTTSYSVIVGNDDFYYNHFHQIANYSQYNGTNGSLVGNLSLLNFDGYDENPYGLRYGMATTVVFRYVTTI